MADIWRIVSIAGLPIGWARMSNDSQYVIKELCIHESNISMGEGYTSRIVSSDPTVPLEPKDPGFYKIDDESGRVFLKSAQTARWTVHFADVTSRMISWEEIAKQSAGHEFVPI